MCVCAGYPGEDDVSVSSGDSDDFGKHQRQQEGEDEEKEEEEEEDDEASQVCVVDVRV